jgi:hypothetical protein
MAPVGEGSLSRSRFELIPDELQIDASIVNSAYAVQGKHAVTTLRHNTLTRPELPPFRRLLASISVLWAQNRPPSHHNGPVGDLELPCKARRASPMDQLGGIAVFRHHGA